MLHWPEGEACYASLTLRPGEQVTGLAEMSDIEALCRTGTARGSDEPLPHGLRGEGIISLIEGT
jgi:hypothetical protein